MQHTVRIRPGPSYTGATMGTCRFLFHTIPSGVLVLLFPVSGAQQYFSANSRWLVNRLQLHTGELRAATTVCRAQRGSFERPDGEMDVDRNYSLPENHLLRPPLRPGRYCLVHGPSRLTGHTVKARWVSYHIRSSNRTAEEIWEEVQWAKWRAGKNIHRPTTPLALDEGNEAKTSSGPRWLSLCMHRRTGSIRPVPWSTAVRSKLSVQFSAPALVHRSLFAINSGSHRSLTVLNIALDEAIVYEEWGGDEDVGRWAVFLDFRYAPSLAGLGTGVASANFVTHLFRIHIILMSFIYCFEFLSWSLGISTTFMSGTGLSNSASNGVWSRGGAMGNKGRYHVNVFH